MEDDGDHGDSHGNKAAENAGQNGQLFGAIDFCQWQTNDHDLQQDEQTFSLTMMCYVGQHLPLQTLQYNVASHSICCYFPPAHGATITGYVGIMPSGEAHYATMVSMILGYPGRIPQGPPQNA